MVSLVYYCVVPLKIIAVLISAVTSRYKIPVAKFTLHMRHYWVSSDRRE